MTVTHTRTKDVKGHCLRADILIVAAGVTEYVKGDWVKPGAVVIDVGVNEVGKTADGKRILKGDVAFEEAAAKGERHYAGSRRSGADDHNDAHEKHRARLQGAQQSQIDRSKVCGWGDLVLPGGMPVCGMYGGA